MTDSPTAILRLSTDRLYIRPPLEQDRDVYLESRRNSRPHLEPWEPIFEDFDSWSDKAFDRLLDRHWTDTDRRLLVFFAGDDAFVGHIGVSTIERGPFQNCRLGWWASSAHTGNGYMTEAIRAVLRWLFTEEHLHRIEANIAPTNAPSIRLAERCGFRRVGFSPRYLQIGGQWRDHEHWAVTVEQWSTQPHPNSGAPE